jgi:hypothetical protein
MQGLGILSSSSGVLKSGAGVTAACDFGRKFSNSVSGSRAFVVLDPKNAFSNGLLKVLCNYIAFSLFFWDELIGISIPFVFSYYPSLN